jgi:Cdc6-like AAA superfamily ATPase
MVAQHEVFKAFFSELSGFLRKDKKFFELAKIYEKYAAALNNVNYHISNIIGIISVSTLFGIITISIINHFIENEIYKTVLEFFRLCLLSFPAAAIVLLTALKKSKSYFIERLESDSLKDIKDRLIEECKNLKEPLVIVLDDIDRLNPEETAALFQLVKANMDFPNIVMILLYERDHVCFSLEKAGIPDAARYIEKIIQIPLNNSRYRRR